MNEIGVDTGIDHMSAMHVIDRIRAKGGKMILFESFTGGLVAPESDNNLWNYKFTWNPRNVVVAGQGGAAKFLQEGTFKYIPYHRLFRRTEFLEIDGFGRFEVYANRDSLKYQSVYGLDAIKTLYRGTMRRVGFSKAWNMFVMLGMTDDSYIIDDSENMSYRDFVNAFLSYSPSVSNNNFDISIFFKTLFFVAVFIYTKYLFEILVGWSFNIRKFIIAFNLQKNSFNKLIGIIIILFNSLSIYSFPGSITFIKITIFFVISLYLIGLYKVIRLNDNLILSNMFYFILYLCTLEIVPILFFINELI